MAALTLVYTGPASAEDFRTESSFVTIAAAQLDDALAIGLRLELSLVR